MRACFYPNLNIQQDYVLVGDKLHHLMNVVRIQENEKLLLLDGNGQSITTTVVNVSKKEISLKLESAEKSERKFNLSLVLGIPKRDALDLILKQAVEIGLKQVFLVRSAFSQGKLPENERLNSLLISALEQSNALFIPEIVFIDFKDVTWSNFSQIIVFDSIKGGSQNKNLKAIGLHPLIVIGPEGGYSGDEMSFILSQKGSFSIHLPTPILRSPTAMALASGMALQALMDQ